MTRTTSERITVPALRGRKASGPKIAMVTAYDATFARLLDEGGADILLVGDSLGMVVQGHGDTLPVTVDDICYHARAVHRASTRAHVVADMPFMSFQGSAEQALDSAGRLVKEGRAEAVKLEGGEVVAEQVRRIVGAGIPVMGHVGLLPQSVHAMGGFRVQGRSEAAADAILRDAEALVAAGVYALVLEGIPSELARRVTEQLSVPTLGIGAGPHCDGQVLVCYDFLGMYDDVRPKFVRRFAELGRSVSSATRDYVTAVRDGSFPGPGESFSGAPPAPTLPQGRTEQEATGAGAVVGHEPERYGPAGDA